MAFIYVPVTLILNKGEFMAVIALAAQKGGVGKTTLAFNLAVMRARKKNVLAIDTDPQKSFVDLFNIRDKKPMPVEYFNIDGSILHKGIPKVKDKYDDIIIDTAGRKSEEMISALVISDIFLIPFRPSRLDLLAMESMDELASTAKAKKPDLKIYAVINQASTHHLQKESKKAIFEFKNFKHIQLLNCEVKDRTIYRQSIDKGLAVIESTNKKAKSEMNTLYNRIF